MFPQRSAEVAIDCCVVLSYRQSRFRNLNSTVPVNIVMVKSCASNLFNSTIVPVRVSVNKLDFVRKWIIATLSKSGRRPTESHDSPSEHNLHIHLEVHLRSRCRVPAFWWCLENVSLFVVFILSNHIVSKESLC